MSDYLSTTAELQKVMNAALMQVGNTKSAIISLTGARPGVSSSKFSLSLNDPLSGIKAPKLSELLEADSTAPEMIRLNSEADAYMAKYFPAASGELLNLPEDWLVDVISGTKPFGIDSTIFDMVWQKARDRAHKAGLSEQKATEANMSARGFSMPPGALIDLIDKQTQKRLDDLADVNREQAIKDAEIKKEILLFAVEQALRYKLGLMQTLADFYKAWMAVPNNELERARIKAQSMSAFYGALSAYHNVEIAFEELRLKAEVARTNVELANQENKVKAFAAGGNNNALGDAAKAFGDIASGAASGAASITAQIENI
jgi:hypothetical protein